MRNAFDIWWKNRQRREVQGIVFDPTREAVPGYYNLWRGFAVEPIPGDWSLFQQHIREVIASGDEAIYQYTIHWMADCVQRPADKPGVTLVLRGDEGLGKGTFATQFGKLFGSHFKHITHSEHLVGRFNAHLVDALLVFADEAFWAGDKQAEGILKTMVTEETLNFEDKYIRAIPLANHIHIIIASNNEWVVPVGLKGRRFCVLDVSNTHEEDHDYFAAILAQMNQGGREALLYHLLYEVNLDGVNLRNFPRTSALFDQIQKSMKPVERFWFDRLNQGSFSEIAPENLDWPESANISCTALYALYTEFIGNSRQKLSPSEFGKELRKCLPPEGFVRVQHRISGSKQRPYFYIFPPLADCRAHFQSQVKAPITWDITYSVTETPGEGGQA
jgi:phage/plasmid-associated DNA primase